MKKKAREKTCGEKWIEYNLKKSYADVEFLRSFVTKQGVGTVYVLERMKEWEN